MNPFCQFAHAGGICLLLPFCRRLKADMSVPLCCSDNGTAVPFRLRASPKQYDAFRQISVVVQKYTIENEEINIHFVYYY